MAGKLPRISMKINRQITCVRLPNERRNDKNQKKTTAKIDDIRFHAARHFVNLNIFQNWYDIRGTEDSNPYLKYCFIWIDGMSRKFAALRFIVTRIA